MRSLKPFHQTLLQDSGDQVGTKGIGVWLWVSVSLAAGGWVGLQGESGLQGEGGAGSLRPLPPDIALCWGGSGQNSKGCDIDSEPPFKAQNYSLC